MPVTLDSYVSQIDAMLEADDTNQALLLADELVEQYPEEIRAWMIRGHLYAEHGDYSEALIDLTRAIELDADEPALFLARGRYALELGDFRQAVRDFSLGIEVCDRLQNDDHREMLHFLRAEVYLRLRKKREALSDLSHVRDEVAAWTYRLRTKAELLNEASQLPGCL
jgi:tetratricopeptide (TPR) repeat protein